MTAADETSRPSSLPPNIRSIKASGKQVSQIEQEI
ncbi:unnamed protein product [Rotaria magnacalcarata]|uniref:Uncharacterized protein n=1 Tax=Rotaria magnacalcarata TaxID=392030 RepID=A0A8S3D5K1_9BILA|nr:unnamed protein product [Rotaria magnacalcarata]CAF4970052.1 unnamed protein product [Rotaria magnacalcarata]